MPRTSDSHPDSPPSRAPAHRALLAVPLADAPGEVVLPEDEAHHAVVKRVRVGDTLALHDGQGSIAQAEVLEIAKGGRTWRVRAQVRRVDRFAPVRPRVELCSAVPKGDRLAELIDQACQAGAASWQPLVTARGVTDAGSIRADRLERVASEALKQSGRAWRLLLGPPVTIDQACAPAAGTRVLLAHPGVGGAGSHRIDARPEPAAQPEPADEPSVVRVLIGPEGGFTPDEVSQALGAGARTLPLGPHVLRTETACVAACAILLASAVAVRL